MKKKFEPAEYFELIKFEHTIFALPFAMSGMLLASGDKFPEILTFIWVILAMAGGRTAAMALNRIIDAEIDKKNPRTINRAIPAGKISKKSALILAIVSFGVMILAVLQLPLICKQLLPFAIFILVVYSYTKRFTHLSHFVLGGGLGAAASGGWLAVNGEITPAAVMWGISIVFWVAGFDIIYALQDIDFDREQGLFSIPAKLGAKNSLFLSRICHTFSALLLFIMGTIHAVGFFYWVAAVFVSYMLYHEHSLLKNENLQKINEAFFAINGYISIGVFFFILLDKIF